MQTIYQLSSSLQLNKLTYPLLGGGTYVFPLGARFLLLPPASRYSGDSNRLGGLDGDR